MSLIDTEQEKLKEWVQENKGHFFSGFDEQTDSYFINSEKDGFMYDLEFSDIRELRELLEHKKTKIHDKKVDLICAVAAFKRKPTILNIGKKMTKEEKQTLPDYIYRF